MRMYVKSVFVDDQAKALDFYTNKLGFEKKLDIPMGEYRWLTLESPEEEGGVELLLEPTAHAAAKVFQQALKDDGIPLTAFQVDDLEAEFKRLESEGVVFTQTPTSEGNVIFAAFDDTCGNLIQLVQIS